MFRPTFFEPTPVPAPVVSILGKRKMEEAFGRGTNDDARYGREIPPDFFNTNHGHIVFSSAREGYIAPANSPAHNDYKNKLKQWREKYNTQH